ncbi:MAG TPA: hypothetical protein VK686_04485 [Bryobacteraceae bacterium]|nr:hypothetical protein [Bryobacteraceae bacterium]
MTPTRHFPKRLAKDVFGLDAESFQWGAITIDQDAVQGVEPEEAVQRIEDIAQPFFAGGQLRSSLQAIGHVANGPDNTNGLALGIADNAAARNHPAICSIPMLEPQFIKESVFGRIFGVTVSGFSHARRVFGMNAPEKRLPIVGQLIVAKPDDFFVAR